MAGGFLFRFILHSVGPEVGQDILEGEADAAPEALVQDWFLLWCNEGSVIWLYIEIHGGYVALHLFLLWCVGGSIIWLRIAILHRCLAFLLENLIVWLPCKQNTGSLFYDNKRVFVAYLHVEKLPYILTLLVQSSSYSLRAIYLLR